MLRTTSYYYVRPEYFFLLGFLLLAPLLFASVPIQEKSLRGTAAAEARLKVLATAESCLGVAYRYGGVDRRGLDCSGLVYLSFREGLHHTIPRSSEGIYNWAQKIETSELQPGDLVFFVTTGSKVSHVGIYSGGGRFIHSASEGSRTGVMYSRLDESYWRRTYKGAGRALPWDDGAAQAMAVAGSAPIAGAAAGGSVRPGQTPPAGKSPPRESVKPANSSPSWTQPGFFVGAGAAWIWGGGGEGTFTPFRGFSLLATAGYKWSIYRLGLEMRPEWDSSLGVYRLPFALSLGTDTFKFFTGPAYIFGDPSYELRNGERYYKGGTWIWDMGISTAFRPKQIGPGALSLYGELAWQSYQTLDGQKFDPGSDIAANLRFSTGLRYLWRL